MARSFIPGISRNGVESSKPVTTKHKHPTLLEYALSADLPVFADPFYAPTSMPFDISACTFFGDETNSNSWSANVTSVTCDGENPIDVGLEIDNIVESSCSALSSTALTKKRQRAAPPVQLSVTHSTSCVHERAPDDSHYPFNVQRKGRTKMQCSVCVWCATQQLMALPGRPVLQKRTSGLDADWERWLRELSSPRSHFLQHLAESLMPKDKLSKIVQPDELPVFYKEIAGALIEFALRELRGGVVNDRAIMTQVRSSKYHKTTRVAKIIKEFYG